MNIVEHIDVRRKYFDILSPTRFVRILLLISALVSGATATGIAQRRAAPQTGERKARQAQAGHRASKRTVSLARESRAALERISAASLRAHLSFLASDALEGRNTPSTGLEVAAEYIAAQFRRAGLEPVGDDGSYFQSATLLQVAQSTAEGFALTFHLPQREMTVEHRDVALSFNVGASVLWSLDKTFDLARARVVKVDYEDADAWGALKQEDIEGRVVVTELPDFRRENRSRWMELYGAQNDFLSRLGALKPALVVSLDRTRPARSSSSSASGVARLVDPQNRNRAFGAPAGSTSTVPPFITVYHAAAADYFDTLKTGATAATLSLRASAPSEKQVKLRNVVGLLRGSDASLKDTYVLLTAHYDHIGVLAGEGAGDRVFNGANDDGSGTVSVVEIASALSTLKRRPRRSILFMTYFGEEKGGLGSRFYGRHPIFPIEKTVANVNLEQVGRTDDTEGARVAAANLTGFDYSTLGTIFQTAGELTGVRVFKHERNSDSYFSRSDNQSLADLGVPAHTLSVAYNFPDYHAVGDHWDKIDYANMEKINRMIAAGILLIADNPQEPHWNDSNPKAERYLKAWRERRKAQGAVDSSQ